MNKKTARLNEFIFPNQCNLCRMSHINTYPNYLCITRTCVKPALLEIRASLFKSVYNPHRCSLLHTHNDLGPNVVIDNAKQYNNSSIKYYEINWISVSKRFMLNMSIRFSKSYSNFNKGSNQCNLCRMSGINADSVNMTNSRFNSDGYCVNARCCVAVWLEIM